MIPNRWQPRDACRVRAALAEAGCEAPQTRDGHWRLAEGNGPGRATTATVVGGWLRLDGSLGDGPLPPRRGLERLWYLVEANARLPGSVRFALTPSRCMRVRAEVPLDDGVDLGLRASEALEGIRVATDLWRDQQALGPGGEQAGQPSAPSGADGALVGQVKSLCKEVGWETTERASGTLAVALEVSGEPYRGRIETSGGRVAVRADLAQAGDLARLCRDAWAVLLLTACGVVRLARGSGGSRDGRWAAWVEVAWPGLPSAAELGHGLAACSVACELLGREVTVLKEEEMAERFLRVRGWSVSRTS
ncbi:MAG: hypothetical protein ACODAJ_16315 [Planctomycetota bacterium]